MELTPEIIKRLSFIKYIYEFAREQSKLPPPQNFISVLMFHDSAELFLHLSAEFLNVNKKDFKFMEYFTEINKKLIGQVLTQKMAMNTLNKERVSLKHYSLYPNPDNIENHRVNIQNFFEENCHIIFGIKFANISLLDLIKDDEVKKMLREAQNESNSGNYKKSLEFIALAFNTLLINYEETKKNSYKSLFDIGEDLEYLSLFSWAWLNDRGGDLDKIGRITETIKEIQKILKILVLNLDSKKYIKFRFLTPIIRYKANGDYYATRTLGSSKGENSNDVKFCMNYVIESALNLQKFDFEIDNIKN